MAGGKHSTLSREAAMMATEWRRAAQRQAEIDTIMTRVDPVNRSNVMRMGEVEADFIRRRRLEDVYLQQNADALKSANGDKQSSSTGWAQQNDSHSIWNVAQTDAGSAHQNDWEYDPDAAEKWGAVESEWIACEPAQETHAQEGETAGMNTELVIHNAQEDRPLLQNDGYSSDEEDEDYNENENEAHHTVVFDYEASPHDERDLHDFAVLAWQHHESEAQGLADEHHGESAGSNLMADTAASSLHHDKDGGSDRFISWLPPTSAKSSSSSNNNNHEIEHKGDSQDQSTHSSPPTPTLPILPPAPLSSHPVQFDTPREVAWPQIGTILADVDFEERLSAWNAKTRALEDEAASRSSAFSRHRHLRTAEVREAETAGILRRNQDKWRVFNVVREPAGDGDTSSNTGDSLASSEHEVLRCSCVGRGAPVSEEDAARCPFNRRRGHSHPTANGSRLRQSVTMRELEAEEKLYD